MKNEILKFVIDGVEIETTAHIAYPGEFLLQMTNPNFESSLVSPHIMYMICAVHRFFDPDGTVTEYGLDHATRMATALYGGYLVVQEKFDILEQKAEETKHSSYQLKLDLERELEECNALRREWKAKFKTGQIPVLQYQKEIKPIETMKMELTSRYQDKKQELIYKALREMEPEIQTIEEKCCGYTVPKTVRCYFWGLVNRKTEELAREMKLKAKKDK
jgi:hypothetical protein